MLSATFSFCRMKLEEPWSGIKCLVTVAFGGQLPSKFLTKTLPRKCLHVYEVISDVALHIKDVLGSYDEMLLSVCVPYAPLIYKMYSFHSIWVHL